MSAVSYLGCKISLVSKSGIRYEGILYTIDTKESTVALAQVRSFGTEDRPAERLVPPRDEIYDYIIFRASDIKDLRVCEPAKQHSLLTSGLSHDPAIVQHSAPLTSCSVPFGQASLGHICGLQTFQHFPSQMAYQHMQPLFPAAPSGTRSGSSSQISLRNKSPTIDAGVQVSSGAFDKDELGSKGNLAGSGMRLGENQSGAGDQRRNQLRQPMQRGRGGRRGRGRGRSGNFGNRSPDPIKFDGEYDFEQANEEFKQLETKLANVKTDDSGTETLPGGNGGGDADDVAYDKQKSFFDNISCEASRVAKGIPRFNWRVERKINVETFGVAASNSWLRRRRGRGGFRRGFPRGNSVSASTEVAKTVTFGTNKIVVVDSVDPPSETEVTKGEEIPTVEIVVEKEKEWQDAKEEWN